MRRNQHSELAHRPQSQPPDRSLFPGECSTRSRLFLPVHLVAAGVLLLVLAIIWICE